MDIQVRQTGRQMAAASAARLDTCRLALTRPVLGLLLAAGLIVALCAPSMAAAAPPPPPVIDSITQRSDGDINIDFHTPQILVPLPNSNGGMQAVKPGGAWGIRFNVYIQQTGERVNTATSVPFPAENYYSGQSNHHDSQDALFNHRGTIDQNRYCVRMQAYVGDGTDAGSVFSAEGNQVCIGTQAVLIVTEASPIPPPPPTKPDLVVTRVTGPDQIFDGTTAVYDVVLWNDGTPALGTAQILIGLDGNIEPADLVTVPDGFTCDLGQYGYSCLGSLGGINDPVETRGALFEVQVRGNGPGSAAVYGSANHDRTLDEMTVDNNLVVLPVTVK